MNIRQHPHDESGMWLVLGTCSAQSLSPGAASDVRVRLAEHLLECLTRDRGTVHQIRPS